MKKLIIFTILVILPGCKFTEMVIRPSIGDTKYDSGERTLNAGISGEFRFDMR